MICSLWTLAEYCARLRCAVPVILIAMLYSWIMVIGWTAELLTVIFTRLLLVRLSCT